MSLLKPGPSWMRSFRTCSRHSRGRIGGEVVPAGLAGDTAGAKVFVQVSLQVPSALDEEGLVDRFVRHLHLLPIGECLLEVVADLLRGPILHQPRLDGGDKTRILELAVLRPACTQAGLFLRCVGPVGAGTLSGVVS